MIKTAILFVLFGAAAFASVKKTESVVLKQPITLDDKTLAAIRSEIDSSKFGAETFKGTVHCNTYKKNGSGLECLLVTLEPEDLKPQKKK